jgi:hypothetical protein
VKTLSRTKRGGEERLWIKRGVLDREIDVQDHEFEEEDWQYT